MLFFSLFIFLNLKKKKELSIPVPLLVLKVRLRLRFSRIYVNCSLVDAKVLVNWIRM